MRGFTGISLPAKGIRVPGIPVPAWIHVLTGTNHPNPINSSPTLFPPRTLPHLLAQQRLYAHTPSRSCVVRVHHHLSTLPAHFVPSLGTSPLRPSLSGHEDAFSKRGLPGQPDLIDLFIVLHAFRQRTAANVNGLVLVSSNAMQCQRRRVSLVFLGLVFEAL